MTWNGVLVKVYRLGIGAVSAAAHEVTMLDVAAYPFPVTCDCQPQP